MNLIDFDLTITQKLNIIHEYSTSGIIYDYSSVNDFTVSNNYQKHLSYFCKKFLTDEDKESLNGIIPLISSNQNYNDTLIYLVENDYIDKEHLSCNPELLKNTYYFIKLTHILDVDNDKFKSYYTYLLNQFIEDNSIYDCDDEDKPYSLELIKLFLEFKKENLDFLISFTKENFDNLNLSKKEIDFFDNFVLNVKLNNNLIEKHSTENKTKI